MLRSIYAGYIPSIVLAAVGYSALGGSIWAWAAFVWLFGAALTVALAYLRFRAEDEVSRPHAMGMVENV